MFLTEPYKILCFSKQKAGQKATKAKTASRTFTIDAYYNSSRSYVLHTRL